MAKEKKESKQKPSKEKYINRKAKLDSIIKLITKSKYSIADASELLPKISLSKFNGSCNLDVTLQLKQKQANETVRGSIVFPHQFGEQKKVLVLAQPDKVASALEAGADYAGLEDMVEKIEKGWLDFDVVIATPQVMPKIAKLGKVLGPRQLMPNPKTGTVTDNLDNAIKLYKSGKVDFKMDAGKTIKLRFAKCEMTATDITANLTAALDAIKAETRKLGPTVIKKIMVSPTMGPKLVVEM